MFPFLLGMFGCKSQLGMGPIKQTILRDKRLIISTANNGGIPFKAGGKNPLGKYESVLMCFDSAEDIDNRAYKSIKLLQTYKKRADALRGHAKHVKVERKLLE